MTSFAVESSENKAPTEDAMLESYGKEKMEEERAKLDTVGSPAEVSLEV